MTGTDTETFWQIQLLGGLEARRAERAVSRFRTYKTAALFARLAYAPHHALAREELVEQLWPEAAPEDGRRSLRVALASLRQQLEPPGVPAGAVLQADRARVRLNPGAVATDVQVWEAALGAAARAAGPAARRAGLARAVSLYGGPLLPGLYEDWVLTERERLTGAQVAALLELAALASDAGEDDQAVDHALRAVAADPLREEAHDAAIRALVAARRLGEARRHLDAWERLLQAELGERPDPALRALLTASAPGAARTRLPTTREREPDLIPIPLSETSGEAASRLPSPLTRFFGREAEMTQISERLLSPGSRLVTLTGPGGAGKTRLAIEVAARLGGAGGDLVLFVPLVDVADPTVLPDAVLGALGAARDPRVSPLEQAAAALARRPGLLVLDNLDHLLAGGADVVRALLERAPTLRCLATSRQPLAIAGEHEYPLGPLPIPDGPAPPERLQEYASVRLLVDRAQAVRPDFRITARNADAVAALCRRLDGLPLALELAASWARTLTPAQMVSRLETGFDLLVSRRRDTPARHGTLWAAIATSYQPLPPALQRFWTHLSVFRGGWTADAAAAVCEEPEAADALAQLRERSLVLAQERESGMRFRLLEPLREFAREQLAPEDLSRLGRRHLEWFLALAERSEPALHGPEPDAWLDRLDAEIENLRAALDWSGREEAGGVGGLRLAAALGWFWCARERPVEGRRRLEDALLRCEAAPDPLRGKAAGEIGRLSLYENDVPRARARLEEGLALLRGGDRQTVADMVTSLGSAVLADEGLAAARPLFEEAIALHRSLRDDHGVARSLETLGQALAVHGRPAEAGPVFEECLALQRRLGHARGIGYTLASLAAVGLATGDYAAGRALYGESLVVQRQAAVPYGIAHALTGIGTVALRQGDLAEARARFGEALALHRGAGRKFGAATVLEKLGQVAATCGDPPAARALYRESLALREEIGDTAGAGCLLSARLGALALEEGDLDTARALREQSAALFRAAGTRWDVAGALQELAEVAAAQGDAARARSLCRDSLAQVSGAGDDQRLAPLLAGLGRVALAAGEPGTARPLLERSLALHRELGLRPGVADVLLVLADVLSREGQLGPASRLIRESLRLRAEMGDRRGRARCLEALAGLWAARGRAAEAGRLREAAEAICMAPANPVSLRDRVQSF